MTVKLLRLAHMLANGVGTIHFVLSTAAFDNAVAQSSRRKALVVGGAEKVLRSISTHFLAVSFVRSIAAVVVTIANEIQRNTHFAGTSKLVDATLLICTSFVLIRSISYTAVVVRIAFPRFGNTAATTCTSKLVWVARRV